MIKLWWGLYDWLCTVIKNNNMLVDGGKNKDCTAIEKLRFLIDNVLFVNKKPGPARRVSGCGPAAVDHLGKQQSWTSPDCCSPPNTLPKINTGIPSTPRMAHETCVTKAVVAPRCEAEPRPKKPPHQTNKTKQPSSQTHLQPFSLSASPGRWEERSHSRWSTVQEVR